MTEKRLHLDFTAYTVRQGTPHPILEDEPTAADMMDEGVGSGYCEDHPCCGHTPADPCSRQWYDEPGAFDTTIRGNEHALCDHENGDCNVEYDEDEDDNWSS